MTLFAAAAQVDVTPDVGGPLAGYGDRGPSTGVLGAITAGVVVLDDGAGSRAVIVTLDAVGVGLPVADRLRRRVAVAAGTTPERVLLNCSHNHAGPDWFDVDADEAADADRMIGLVTGAAAQAIGQLRRVQIYLVTGQTGVAVNRREIGADGHAVMGTNERGHVDRRTTTLVIRERAPHAEATSEHDVLATVTIAAVHGNCLKGDNTCLAPDFVGAFRDELSARTGAPAFFLQGCAGDLNPAPHPPSSQNPILNPLPHQRIKAASTQARIRSCRRRSVTQGRFWATEPL